VPGYHGDNQEPAFLSQQAAEIGFPVLIKAVAGGGGKGMRLVTQRSDFAEALASAQAEALSGFGNGAVLIEKYITTPRHIEIQVFGDGAQAVHLFERDCSLQRRHQKVIEEAPAPGMTPEMRAAMGQAAVTAAQMIGYKGAGTVEFIVDASDGLRPDRFWFMEMNTRLQVEHPVTEAITGVDLVAWQLHVAFGAPLPLMQDALSINGHAIEARLYAEDPANDFLPATGRLSHLRLSPLARSDSAVRGGDIISPYYDPMIAKLVTHAPTRAAALKRMSHALSDCEVAGTVTNLAFLGGLVAHPEFVAGDVDTGLIARSQTLLTTLAVAPPEPWLWAQAALAAAGLTGVPNWDDGFTLWAPLQHRIDLQHRSEMRQVLLRSQAPDQHHLEVDGHVVVARWQNAQWSFDGHAAVSSSQTATEVTLFSSYGLAFDLIDPLARMSDEEAIGPVVTAPMPGQVRSVMVSLGQSVSQGDSLMILEAMKMEHSLKASRDGVVAEVLIEPGQQVAAGDALIRLDEEAG